MWPEVLPRIQALLNNSAASGASTTPNEVTYRFTPNRPLDLLNLLPSIDYITARILVSDAVAFAQISGKFHYNRQHQPIFLKAGNWALLRLHRGYNIPATLGVTRKISVTITPPRCAS